MFEEILKWKLLYTIEMTNIPKQKPGNILTNEREVKFDQRIIMNKRRKKSLSCTSKSIDLSKAENYQAKTYYRTGEQKLNNSHPSNIQSIILLSSILYPSPDQHISFMLVNMIHLAHKT